MQSQPGNIHSTGTNRGDHGVRARSQNKCLKYSLSLSDLALQLKGVSRGGQLSSAKEDLKATGSYAPHTLLLNSHQSAVFMRD